MKTKRDFFPINSWWFYRSRLALRWYLPSTLPRNCISVDLGPRQEVGRSSCTLSRGGKRGKGQKCMNCCEVPRSSTRQSGTMRSVTPFRVVGLKTTGDCWHCWKATRSTLYIFLRLYFSSLFFTRSVFFLLSGSKHIGRNKSMFLQFSSNFSFRIRAYSSYVEIDERGSGIITRRYCLDRCGKFPLFFERRHVIRFWGSVNRRGGWKIRFIREYEIYHSVNVSLYALAMRSDTILSNVIYDALSCPSKI